MSDATGRGAPPDEGRHRMSDGGWRLAPGVRALADGRLTGGRPFRVVRLSAAGGRALASLLGSGEQPAPESDAAALADRLVGYGMLLAPPLSPAETADLAAVTVVIPARSQPEPVAALLATVPPEVPVILVDDGSPRALASALPPRPNTVHLRNDHARGPAAARNSGAGLATTRWIAFVDADVVPGPEWLAKLCAYLPVPGVVAVAPRIVSAPTGGIGGWVERYSAGLDLGPTPADVGPGSPVSYVPTALLVVDRAAFAEIGGFEPRMQVGEDVDLVWRLLAHGRVRYEPHITAVHDPRRSLAGLLRRRYLYGTGAAALDERHAGILRHVDVSIWSFGPWILAVAVHPMLGLAAAVATVVGAPRTLRALSTGDAIRLAGRGQLIAAGALGRWLVRPLWPLTVVLLLSPARRRSLAGAVMVGLVDLGLRVVREDVRTQPNSPPLPILVRSLIGRTVDDLAYSLGIWAGCVRAGRFAALYPRIRQVPDLRRAPESAATVRRFVRHPRRRPTT